MNRHLLALILFLVMFTMGGTVMSKETSKIVRTYMQYGLPIDPANVRTLVDLDLSYALGTTLVGWSPTRELVSGLAESWQTTGEKEITFKIKSSKWSDGKQVTADQVVKALLRAKRDHGDSLKTLYDYVITIESKGSDNVIFKLNVPAATSGVVRKLTEPMYSVVAVKEDGSVDLSKSTGPYILKSATESQIELVLNKNWIFNRSNMAESVEIRRPPKGEELQDAFLKDAWANLLSSSSLISEKTNDQYKKAKYQVWHRTLDKVFLFGPSPRLANADGRELLKFLNRNLDKKILTKGLSGFDETKQFFPQGYVLFDPEFPNSKVDVKIPTAYTKKPLEILAADSRVSETLRNNIKDAIKSATGVEPIFKLVSLSEFESARAAGKYDLLAGALPINDPNVEGFMGFVFGLTPSIIPNAGTGNKDFQARIKNARSTPDQLERNLEYRKIFTESVLDGCVLPLFHYSTIVIAKEGIDLSQIPTTDETVAFSKVQFK